MMTWYIWRIFYNSLPRHPLFWQELHPPESDVSTPVWQRRLRQALVVLMVPAVFLAFFWLAAGGVLLLYLMLFTGALVAGTNAAMGVANAINQEQTKQRYDLIAMTPPGMFGIGWALGTRFLRKNRRTLRFTRLIRGFHLICLLMVVAIVLLSNFLLQGRGLGDSTISQLLVGVLFIVSLHLDFVQSGLIGALVGMLVPSYARRMDTNLIAPVVFIAIKLGTYLVIGVGLSFVGWLLERLGLIDALALFIFIALILVFITHEAALYWIWRMIEYRLNLEPDTLRTMKRFGL
ncbi:MAG: hypothetical protein H7X77_07160 [Anaerolineae bacterium]|nr:hypothetical protein [Anaerolineae bacterium]